MQRRQRTCRTATLLPMLCSELMRTPEAVQEGYGRPYFTTKRSRSDSRINMPIREMHRRYGMTRHSSGAYTSYKHGISSDARR